MAFDRVKKILDNALALDENEILNRILSSQSFQEFIIDLNTQGQLFDKGIDSLSVSLGNYAATTIEGTSSFRGKKDKGQRFDHVTLHDTGEFYKSFKIVLKKISFEIVANPVKDDSNLFDDWGRDIVGLTEENLQIVRDAVKEKIIPLIKKELFA